MSRLERYWWRDGPPPGGRAAALPLAAGEALFRAGGALRRALYDRALLPSFRAAVPVVSVGNLVVGGAGKTPVALAIGARLLARGERLAVLSRGYGAERSGPRVVSDGERLLLDVRGAGDEPTLIARRLPAARVLCGPRRAELARRAVADLGASALLLDDGFQHRALARDLDVVVLDAADPFGNGRLLPRGPNREPPSALGRAGLLWLTRVDAGHPEVLEGLRELARRLTGRGPVESVHAPVAILDGALEHAADLGALRGCRVLLLTAMARPERFRATVEQLGAEVTAERSYRDHHFFSDAEVEAALDDAARERCHFTLVTEKDAVRLSPAAARHPRLRALRIQAQVAAGEGELSAALDAALAAGRGA
ncbi:tetraacyldisaccharide 4'-kinase [Anaeromyxobacter paludicola]|uniref:Tetraacyldisaccharide 4'-kinase n=1 Tax=Anaeromyxobacter paludicola TaxID=2918171 RepID=A0ABN6N8I2_9BACT|nr:tetraacyldisaccharide 4'-kinase [Anaeromyxobacter paludicola]BDG08158.1 tetraacyldisaccharide 4'-kinase [Anaeromyxobacter paludicola]